jgi:hypothetical protein
MLPPFQDANDFRKRGPIEEKLLFCSLENNLAVPRPHGRGPIGIRACLRPRLRLFYLHVGDAGNTGRSC